jgi:hypothetical protein
MIYSIHIFEDFLVYRWRETRKPWQCGTSEPLLHNHLAQPQTYRRYTNHRDYMGIIDTNADLLGSFNHYNHYATITILTYHYRQCFGSGSG